jgi:hypothetical protein
MDNDEEMIQQIMEDEAACDDDVQGHLAITVCIQKMLDDAAEKKKRSHRFKTGKKEVKAMAEIGWTYHAIQ